ncbi:MAG TPA: PD-(D/E)XK nuclease family protein [Vicinamibacterales bacterium]|nr:PD-(D/E)XK nuclease family protein [Vicinamibacterales bacterium]
MITPRTTRLVRAADLQAFQRAILASIPADPIAARGCAVIVPSRSAAEELRRTMENAALAAGAAIVIPDLATRDEWYARLRERLPGAPPLLTAFHREALLRRSAIRATQAGAEPPFNLRAGLVVEILALYDELRRRHRTVADFDRLMTGALEPGAEYDRGAARLLAQTRFLTAAFTEFEQALAGVGGVDEHRIRALALESPRPLYRRVVVTVPDQSADKRGLWTADFDLLARMPGLAEIDVIATEALLEAGFHQRLHETILPGIEDVRFGAAAAPLPILVVPDAAPGAEPARVFLCRDREEELAAFVRALKTRGASAAPLSRTAIAFQRPLPYLYLARQVFADAGMPYQALDALPLAGEPFAASVDIVFGAIAADFTRGALIELLRCPHFVFIAGSAPLTIADVHVLDRLLVDRKYLGGIDRLTALAEELRGQGEHRLSAAAQIASELAAAAAAATAPAQIEGILGFIAKHERPARGDEPWLARHLRARAAVRSALTMLRDAHAAHDPAPLSIAQLSGSVRRWIDGQTFSPRLGDSGVTLLDASAVPYADLDELRLVGLTEADWPERGARSIFYPQSLLAQLGWPKDQDRLSASRARFQDLLRLPRRRVSLSTITLEDDAIVSPSPLIEDVDAVGLPIERFTPAPGLAGARVFAHEALSLPPVVPGVLAGEASAWLALRAGRSFEAARFRGVTGPRAASVYAVSRLERYLECPFKFYAAHVLKLPEERDEQAWMTPQERGSFVHEVFESFFTEWQRLGRGAVTTANMAEAIELFDRIATRHLDELPEGDRALERTLLLGSAAAAGFGERAFAFEIEDDVAVVERLLEHQLEGVFTFEAAGAQRRVALRSKADRIDLLADGTLRIVDYKIGRAPERKRSLQLPIYGACAEQALAGRHGRQWTLARAGYIAFKEKTAFVELPNVRKAASEGQERLLAVIDAVERGEFPVQPDEPFLCNWCAYPGVCRKDYVGDDL